MSGFGNGDNGNARDRLGHFLPGSAGGPGRPKSLHRATLRKALTLADVERAASVLRNLMDSDDETVRMKAACEVLDRSCGKPANKDDEWMSEVEEVLRLRGLLHE